MHNKHKLEHTIYFYFFIYIYLVKYNMMKISFTHALINFFKGFVNETVET